MNTTNTQTPEELEEQTVKAYAAWRNAWRKNPRSVKIQYRTKSGNWEDCDVYPSWHPSEVYRIKPEPPKPVEVDVWFHSDSRVVRQCGSHDDLQGIYKKEWGWVRATATIKVKEGK